MKKIITLFVLILTFSVLAKETGGGVIVGNGAGYAEGLFQQAYQSLPIVLNSFISTNDTTFTKEEISLLEKINLIAKNNNSKKDRLIFLSENDHPGFFTTGATELHRFAKTFATTDSPIFINLDWVYTDEGKKSLNHSSVIALLIHEIGHQTGELNHLELDILGAKVKTYIDGQTNQYNFNFLNSQREKSTISFLITNLEQPKKTSFLRFKSAKSEWTNLTTALLHNLQCDDSRSEVYSLELSNGHFTFDKDQQLVFQAWIQFSCSDNYSEQFTSYRNTLNINLDQNFDIKGMFLE
jgi:hypothetical protein